MYSYKQQRKYLQCKKVIWLPRVEPDGETRGQLIEGMIASVK